MEYIFPQKADLDRIVLANLDLEIPDIKNTEESKSVAIAKWMMGWIDEYISNGKISIGNLLPTKADFAYFLGVSVGTIQNALRYIEDMGYVESKQRIGTIIKDKNIKNSSIRKLTSKRESAINDIKKFIISNKIKVGHTLPSSRAIAALINCSANTTRLALEYLCAKNILEHNISGDNSWRVISTNFNKNFSTENAEQQTLVTKIEQDLKNYIDENLSVGDKLPAHS
jgi:DNA-binding GntR family transcriptional regulator